MNAGGEVEGTQPVPFRAEGDLRPDDGRETQASHDLPRKVTRVPTTERGFQDAVTQCLWLHGYLTYHTHDSRRSQPGFPDIVAVHPKTGYVWVGELKSTTGKVTDAQQEWIDAFQAGGIDADVYWPDHLDIIITRIKKGAGR